MRPYSHLVNYRSKWTKLNWSTASWTIPSININWSTNVQQQLHTLATTTTIQHSPPPELPTPRLQHPYTTSEYSLFRDTELLHNRRQFNSSWIRRIRLRLLTLWELCVWVSGHWFCAIYYSFLLPLLCDHSDKAKQAKMEENIVFLFLIYLQHLPFTFFYNFLWRNSVLKKCKGFRFQ